MSRGFVYIAASLWPVELQLPWATRSDRLTCVRQWFCEPGLGLEKNREKTLESLVQYNSFGPPKVIPFTLATSLCWIYSMSPLLYLPLSHSLSLSLSLSLYYGLAVGSAVFYSITVFQSSFHWWWPGCVASGITDKKDNVISSVGLDVTPPAALQLW